MKDGIAIDSRDYIVALELRSPEDIPPDFQPPPTMARFDAGLFLPRDDPDWFGRSSYPPRVLLLTHEMLRIVPHPASHETIDECPIDRISSVEVGHMLLKGWVRLSGDGVSCKVRFNTRGFPSISRFLARLREHMLCDAIDRPAAVRLGEDLDIKFGNALAQELERKETVAAQLFQPPRIVKKRIGLLPQRHHFGGDLLVKTGRRLLWITDSDRGFHARYGSVVSYAPLRTVNGLELVAGRGGCALRVNLPGAAWEVPVTAENAPHAKEFMIRAGIQRNRREPAFTPQNG